MNTHTTTTTPNGVRPLRGEAAATRARMAQSIADSLIASGSCTEADLERAGFTRDEILLHKAEAVVIARQDPKVRQALSEAA